MRKSSRITRNLALITTNRKDYVIKVVKYVFGNNWKKEIIKYAEDY